VPKTQAAALRAIRLGRVKGNFVSLLAVLINAINGYVERFPGTDQADIIRALDLLRDSVDGSASPPD
jgi:hypothetical protein